MYNDDFDDFENSKRLFRRDYQATRVTEPFTRESWYKRCEQQSMQNALRCVDTLMADIGNHSEESERNLAKTRILNVANRDIVENAQTFIDHVKTKLAEFNINYSDYKQNLKFEVMYLIAPSTITYGNPPRFDDIIYQKYINCSGVALIKYVTIIDNQVCWDVALCGSMARRAKFIINDMFNIVGEEDNRREETANLVLGTFAKKLLDAGYSLANDAYDAVTQR